MIWLILWALCGLIPLALCIYNSGKMDVFDLFILTPLSAIAGAVFPVVIVLKIFFEWVYWNDILSKTIWQKRR